MLRWVVVALFVAILAAAAVSDVRSRRIPNWSVLALAVLFVGWVFVGPSVSLLSSVEAAGFVFLVTAALYYFNIFGAGDSKLMTAVALFAGLGHLLQVVFMTTLAGGVLALVSLAGRPTRTLVMLQTRSKDRASRGIPYGVAIALGGVLTMAGILSGIVWPLHAQLPH
jgi:prepilin peptidase CpaA